MLKWLHEHRTEGCTAEAMDNAAKSGRLEMVQYLHQFRSEGCTTDALDGAMRNGHLDVMQYLFENRQEGCSADAVQKCKGSFDPAFQGWLDRYADEAVARAKKRVSILPNCADAP